MAGYKHPCIYCGKFIWHDSNVCPMCGHKDPFFLSCPKCLNRVEKEWIKCSKCGLSLRVLCHKCGRNSFIQDHCEHCGTSMLVACSNKKCKFEQLPIGEECIKCGKLLIK